MKDRITGARLALKVLAEDAGDAEVLALVREAMALSGLEGLGVPRIMAFGSLAGGARRFLVRELVVGQSLADLLEVEGDTTWTHALAKASAQLTALHRAGFLHGDVKPANVVVGAEGQATLVDLGLAAPWREGGTLPVGLTPKYAAPELFEGEPLTVRAEVYALGASLAEGLERRGHELANAPRRALAAIAARATEEAPGARFPSVDEFESALRLAVGLPPTLFEREAAWPVLGVEISAAELVASAAGLRPGQVLPVVGPPGSGRTTLVRRLAWTLGVRGHTVATFDAQHGAMSPREVLELQLGERGAEGRSQARYLILDDVDGLDEEARDVVKRALSEGRASSPSRPRSGSRTRLGGARAAVHGATARRRVRGRSRSPRDAVSAELPSLSSRREEHGVPRHSARLDATAARSSARLGGRDGRGALPGAAVDAAVVDPGAGAAKGGEARRHGSLRRGGERAPLGRAVAREGRGGSRCARSRACRIRPRRRPGGARPPRHRRARGQGDAAPPRMAGHAGSRVSPRGSLRRGRSPLDRGARRRAGDGDAVAADAIAIRGLSFVYDGRDTLAREELDRAVLLAQSLKDRRIEAIALCSLAIAQQRGGRNDEARATYLLSLAAAEEARDASTVATVRLNLSNLAQLDGDLKGALLHLEAAVDMGRRSGALVAVQQALLNLANLDLYLGRYARAGASIEALAKSEDELGPVARADLTGLRADLEARTGDATLAGQLYAACATARSAQGRVLDAIEAHLEGMLVRVKAPGATAAALGQELDALKEQVKGGGFLEHQALADLVEGTIALAWGEEAAARTAFDRALASAEKAGRKEWAWRTLDARARLLSTQGSMALARRDVDDALAILEEIASKLPRDLREVFWDDPRRHSLRQAHYATSPAAAAPHLALPPRVEHVATQLGQTRSTTRSSATSSRTCASWRRSTTSRAFTPRSPITPSTSSAPSAASSSSPAKGGS